MLQPSKALATKTKRAGAGKKAVLVPSSFRGFPTVLDPLNTYASRQKRSLTAQLDIIFDNYLRFGATAAEIENSQLPDLVGRIADLTPTSFRTDEHKLNQIRTAAEKAGVSLSTWINIAIAFCLKHKRLEPTG